MTVPECPLCGYTNPDADDPEASVIAHMQGSSDEQHVGIGYEKAKQMLRLDDGTTAPDSPDSDSPDSTDALDNNSGEEPDESSADDSPQNQSTQSTGLGLSGNNPFKQATHDPDSESENVDVEPDEDDSSGIGAIALLGTVAAVGMAIASSLKDSSSDQHDQTPEVV